VTGEPSETEKTGRVTDRAAGGSATDAAAAPVLLERSGNGIAVVTLNRADRRNAMTTAMTAAWAATMGQLRADPTVRAVVVTGSGSAFCAGGDLEWLQVAPDTSVAELRTRMIGFYRTWLSVRDLEVPTIAAVNGAAVGAGLALALACDIRYVAADAPLSAPFTSLGLHPGMATTWLLPEVAGLAVARDLLLTGRVVRGEEAVGLGLASQCLPGDAVLAAARTAAERVAAAAPVATRLTKLALAGGGHADVETALRWEALAQAVTMAGADLQEGLAAQRERRSPRFPGP